MRYLRTLLLGGGVALLPFALVLAFTWARNGRAASAVTLLGRGELLPAAAVLSAQALALSYGAPTPFREPLWTARVMLAWSVVALSCATYMVPFAGVTGYEGRVAGFSTVVFTFGVAVHVSTARSTIGGRGP